jgi:hypothetical protein
MMMKGSVVAGAGSQKAHFPRLTSSLIKTLAVYVNGTLIERIDNYHIYIVNPILQYESFQITFIWINYRVSNHYTMSSEPPWSRS